MVVSRINKDISYPEIKKINNNDVKKESNLYQIEIANDAITKTDVIVAIGNAIYTFKDDGIVYFPIYLVKKDKSVTQIGVYEIEEKHVVNYTDENKNLQVEKVGGYPLVYSFISQELLETERLVPQEDDVSDDEASENGEEEEEELSKTLFVEKEILIPENRKDIFIPVKGVAILPELKAETKAESKDIIEKYKMGKKKVWIQNFMKNDNYGILDNEGGGDCLFATIRDAFQQIAQQTTVPKLRTKLSLEASDSLFQEYRTLYDDAMKSIIMDTDKIKLLELEHAKYEKMFHNTLDRDEKLRITEHVRGVIKEREQLINQKAVSQRFVNEEYKMMKHIPNLDAFKKKIQSCDFWADTWAISTLERVLNIKFIILQEHLYKINDNRNILNCGQFVDNVLQNAGTFEPEYYLIVNYTGNHYKLILYKGKSIFTFNELPYGIKEMIVDKCMEKNAGPFDIIPDFILFKEQIKGRMEDPTRFEELSEAKIRGLYDDDIVFCYYNHSNSKPLPGKGHGEKILPDRIRDFAELAVIPEWRKKMDNSWEQPFGLDNNRWNSVVHYYEANKYKKSNPEFYLSFALESGTKLSKSSEMAKAAGSKSGKFGEDLIRPIQVKIDKEYDDEMKNEVLKKAMYAKFSQNEDLKSLLLFTQNAKLLSSCKSKVPKLEEDLMFIREKMKSRN